MKNIGIVLTLSAMGLVSVLARAEERASEPPVPEVQTEMQLKNLETEKTPTRTPAKSPYALPWQLRSVVPGNGVRFDSANAFYKDRNGNSGGFANASMLGGSYKVIPNLAVSIRVGAVTNHPPGNAAEGTSFLNPVMGGLYSLELPHDLRAAFSLGATVPVGMGGGDSPHPRVLSANSAGVLARSAMDNALFAANYFTVIPGVDLAYIAHGWTLQVEATLLQLTRVRGARVDRDPSRTNFTSGFAAGYAVLPEFFLLGELRYQRWLKNATVSASAHPAKENLSFAFGPRFSFKVGDSVVKPGIAYAQGLAGPIAREGYTSPTHSDKIIFVDLPVAF